MRKLILFKWPDLPRSNPKGVMENGKKRQTKKSNEEAHPFGGMSQVNKDATGIDIAAVEIVACIAGKNSTQIVRGFGNYTVDLQSIRNWLNEHHVNIVAMES